MADNDHDKLEKLFTAALEKESSAERLAFLDGACGDDPELRSRVDALLEVHGEATSFLDVPPVDPQATVIAAAPPRPESTAIGRYKILQEIGEGGFGTVYLAEQEEPVRRKVALKIIKLGMDTKQVVARFEAERQALALMDHPNIARALDAGATDTGRPYFVMELVRGTTITQYCDEHRLSPPERLELFLPVCHAVQHAHQKGIIHRDLKPSNVLVTLADGVPVPKVIDFGIAKATSHRLTDKTLFTEFRQFLGTPEYMSPDQAEISGLDVDTRTDIYSLGVLLYELLTGTTPFDATMLREASFEEVSRIIREVEPPKPSTRLQTRATTGQGKAGEIRIGEPLAISRLIRGDLDWIVMKALEKDRTRRYATAKDLADDLERHLRHQPVSAGPPSVFYSIRKFVRRHRVGVLASTIVVGALLTGLSLAISAWLQADRDRQELAVQKDAADQARKNEEEERSRAEQSATEAQKQAARSATMSQFLHDMLSSVDPSTARGREVTVRYMLDEAAAKIESGALSDQPEVEAALRMTLGETYEALGLYDSAEKHVRVARTIWTRTLGEEHPDTLRSSRAMAGILRVKGDFSGAETLLRRTAAAQERVLGPEDADTLETMNELALALWGPGRYAEAEPIHRQTLAIQQRVLGSEHEDTLLTMVHLGSVLRSLQRLSEAESVLRPALEMARRALGDEHPCTRVAMNDLGLFYESQGDPERAETHFREAYQLDRRILGPDHPQTLIVMNNLLRILRARGDEVAIHSLDQDNLERLEQAAQRPEATALALHAYAWELLNCQSEELRNPERSLTFARLAVERGGESDATVLETLASAYHASGEIKKAIEVQLKAVAAAGSSEMHSVDDLKATLLDYYVEDGDVFGAASLSFGGIATRIGDRLATETDAGADLIAQAEAEMAEERFAAAAETLRGCLAVRGKELASGHWLIADTRSRLGRAKVGLGNYGEAEPLLITSYEELSAHPEVTLETRREAYQRLMQLYEAWNRPDKLEQWRKRAPAGG